ncbi:MAG TPA: enoyl-CoA hydratase-related protein, partial [Burkholderiales bacterium]|nr:enoyl-CoA hydratase-related protein [Burkholderiales bacterium]
MNIKSRIEDRIAFVELARLDKKNALTSEMYVALAAALAAADADPQVRAIVLHGAPDCFTAGNDLGDFLKRPPGAEPPVVGLFKVLPNLAKPIVA